MPHRVVECSLSTEKGRNLEPYPGLNLAELTVQDDVVVSGSGAQCRYLAAAGPTADSTPAQAKPGRKLGHCDQLEGAVQTGYVG
jgi:hypothetical protein